MCGRYALFTPPDVVRYDDGAPLGGASSFRYEGRMVEKLRLTDDEWRTVLRALVALGADRALLDRA